MRQWYRVLAGIGLAAGLLSLAEAEVAAENSAIVAWGFNEHGQCDVPEPNEDFIAAAGGHVHSLGLKADGSIVAWGNNWVSSAGFVGERSPRNRELVRRFVVLRHRRSEPEGTHRFC